MARAARVAPAIRSVGARAGSIGSKPSKMGSWRPLALARLAVVDALATDPSADVTVVGGGHSDRSRGRSATISTTTYAWRVTSPPERPVGRGRSSAGGDMSPRPSREQLSQAGVAARRSLPIAALGSWTPAAD